MSAADDVINAERDALAAELAVALGEGITVTTDVRGLNPPCVLVGVPTGEVAVVRTCRILFPVHVVATAPGNDDAVRWILARLWTVLVAVRPVLEWRPGPYEAGDRTYPAETLIVARDVAFC
jgi:hypothetical protein